MDTLQIHRAMGVISFSSLPMPATLSSPLRKTLHHTSYVQSRQCIWRFRSAPCRFVRRPLPFRVAASSKSNGRWPSSPKSKKLQKESDDEDDALEALFSQLEKDLEKDELSDNDEDPITEDEVARFEEELSDAISDGEDDEDELPDYSTLKLENWQLQKLAAALELGRRKASIKKLTAELGLERDAVLEILRNPSPQLLFFQAERTQRISVDATHTVLSDEAKIKSSESEHKLIDSVAPSMDEIEAQKNDPKVPVYVSQMGWNKKKRIKKVHIATLEKVYQRTRRPTETMVDNLIHLTKLPRNAILQWFEDKRSQETAKFVYKKQ